MANQEIKVPDIGDFSDVEIIEVLVSPGDKVNVDDALITVESDKASMDIPSSADGTVVELKVNVGDKVSEGSLILVLDAAGGGDTSAADQPETKSEPEAKAEAEQPKDTSPLTLSISEPVKEVMSHRTIDKDAVYASPSVRRLARERNIDLTRLSGTGPKGRITKEDLDSPMPKPQPSTAAASAAAGMSRNSGHPRC